MVPFLAALKLEIIPKLVLVVLHLPLYHKNFKPPKNIPDMLAIFFHLVLHLPYVGTFRDFTVYACYLHLYHILSGTAIPNNPNPCSSTRTYTPTNAPRSASYSLPTTFVFS